MKHQSLGDCLASGTGHTNSGDSATFNRRSWPNSTNDPAKLAAVNRPPRPEASGPLASPQAPLGADKLAFDKPICENTAPTRPAVIMSKMISKSMAETATAIKALIQADQFWPDPMR